MTSTATASPKTPPTPDADIAQLEGELTTLRRRVSERDHDLARAHREADSLREELSRDRTGAAMVLVGAVALAGLAYLGQKPFAWGDAARRNAERQAVVHLRRTRPVAPVSVYCAQANVSCLNGYYACVGTMPDGASTIVCCDDDHAPFNDGCHAPDRHLP